MGRLVLGMIELFLTDSSSRVLTIGQMIIKMKVADHDHTFDLLEQSGCWRPLMGPE